MMEAVEERLWAYLNRQATLRGRSRFTLPMKMKDLATYLGTTPETLSRKFKNLQAAGKICLLYTSVTGYTISLAVFILPFGLLSDKFGKLSFSYIGLIIFGLSSLLCGLSANIQMLIMFRIFQGIGAAALQATSASLITTLVSAEKSSSAIGVLGIMIGVGLSLIHIS